MTNQLCSNVIGRLSATTAAVVQLHARLRDASVDGGRVQMLRELEQAMLLAQQTLQRVGAGGQR